MLLWRTVVQRGSMQRMDQKCFLAAFGREWLALSWPELHLRASQTLIEGGWQINFLKRVIGQSCGVVLTAW